MKKKSEAYLKAEAYRDAMNKGCQKILAKDLSCVVYLYDSAKGQPVAVGYRGRALKPAINYRYSSEAVRAERVADWMGSVMDAAAAGPRKAKPRDFEVGDVLRCSWGYEQTNIDYFQVIRLVGKQSVEIRKISASREYDGQDYGSCVPNLNDFTEEAMIKKADGDRVKIYSFASAYKMEPIVNVAGAKAYGSSSWSAYY